MKSLFLVLFKIIFINLDASVSCLISSVLLIALLGIKFICILKLQFDLCGVYLLKSNDKRISVAESTSMTNSYIWVKKEF